MGRPPSNGGPSFRFNPTEVAEMEAVLQAHNTQVPVREVLVSLAEKFSASSERSGKFVVQMKQVWNWFQNRRYALRAKTFKAPSKVTGPVMLQSEPTIVRTIPQTPQPCPPPSGSVRPMIQAHQGPQSIAAAPSASAGRNGSDNTQMEFEAKSARDGAWYDVSAFLSHKSMETGDPEVLVRFAGFGSEEDEWVNVRRNVRQRSLPCESSECVAVLSGDLILCFQEGKEQALYFDAHVLDAQRRRHDVRGCRCRFLVRYDHDQSEEIVPLRKICRRPETDHRLEQLNADSATMKQQKATTDPQTANTLNDHRLEQPNTNSATMSIANTLNDHRLEQPNANSATMSIANTLNVYSPAETEQKPPPAISSGKPTEPIAETMKMDEHVTTSNPPKAVDHVNAGPNLPPVEKQHTTTDSQTCNTLKIYPQAEPQEPPTESVPESHLEPELLPQAEPILALPAEPTSTPPAESMPSPTSKDTEEEEHANIEPIAPDIISVPVPNPIETTDDQLNAEKQSVAPIASASGSSPTTLNPIEAIDEWLNAEDHSHAAATIAPDASVADENKDVVVNDAENVSTENTSVSQQTAIQNDVMVESFEAMDYASDAMASSTDMLDAGGASGSLQQE